MKIIHRMFITPVTAMVWLALLGSVAFVEMRQHDQRMFDLGATTFAAYRQANA